MTEARLVERTLRRQALHDPLTGLPNRYLFLDRLETAAARHLRSEGRGTAVLYLDLDHFKPINDGHGHQVGDEVIQEVAARLAGAGPRHRHRRPARRRRVRHHLRGHRRAGPRC